MASLYADEHVPLAVIRALQRDGHDVARARERFPAGTPDAPSVRVIDYEIEIL